ncbi:MAG: RIP metalloprotease RseP [Pseudobutyrivibrio sp.]|nr:RIP metalloprotease RseP [Pseudobutyrivibrio sp.]
MKIIIAIFIFSVIILFHELGHFLFAKKCNVKVNEFSLGLGPNLISWGKGETKYCIKLFPFGGACVMEGEDEESDNDRAFNKKTVWERFQIVFAGPFFNFIMAFVLSVIYIGLIGADLPYIGDVIEGYAAEEAGLEAGDKIIKMDNYNVHFYNEVRLYTTFHSGKTIDVTYERDNQRYKASLVPKYSEENNAYLIGITSTGELTKLSLLKTLEYGFYEVKYQIYITGQSLKMLFTGQLSVNDMSGPVGIVDTFSTVYDQSVVDGYFYVFINFLSLTILLSANLGVMNLLPFPALDGGRIFLLAIEAIRGKKMKAEIENGINLVGFALLMGLMVFVMFNDITKLIH